VCVPFFDGVFNLRDEVLGILTILLHQSSLKKKEKKHVKGRGKGGKSKKVGRGKKEEHMSIIAVLSN
jgi:hypothetical protein